jgi:DNA-binding phage protein
MATKTTDAKDRRVEYIVSSTEVIAQYGRLELETSEKRQKAIQSLLNDGWTVTQIAEATGINRQTLYKAARPKAPAAA